jgi:hypothetical protein
MKCCIASLAAILLFAAVSVAQSNHRNDRCQGLDRKTAALVSQYQELRNKRRQLPQGEYDVDLNDDQGRLHEVLSSLGVELGHSPYTKEKLLRCLGKPDALRSSRQMGNFLDIYHRELRKAGRKIEVKRNREYLIYFWRGWHDFIFFISEGGVIVDHGWWFAYE